MLGKLRVLLGYLIHDSSGGTSTFGGSKFPKSLVRLSYFGRCH